MPMLYPLPLTTWAGALPAAEAAIATDALEAGHVLFLPNLRFSLSEAELAYLSPELVGKSKNVSYDPSSGSLGGAVAAIKVHELRDLMERFAQATRELVATLFPSYKSGLEQAKTSLLPVEVSARRRLWRKDDTRLRVDSFPGQPSNGKRILRVFSNVNPDGRSRVWKVGEPFEAVAQRFWNELRPPLPGERGLLATIRVTNGVRSRYDHYMLKLRDAMTLDPQYQEQFASATCEFPAGSTWVCFTDQVSHAAVSGMHQLEQTFWVDVNVLRHQESAPLRVLESLAGRKLA